MDYSNPNYKIEYFWRCSNTSILLADTDSNKIHRHYYVDQNEQFVDTSIYSLQVIDDYGTPLQGVPVNVDHHALLTDPYGNVFIYANDKSDKLDITFPKESDFFLDQLEHTFVPTQHHVMKAKRKKKVNQ